MNLQGLFDKVAQHLLKQKTKSMQDRAFAYRGEEGRMCAVGCLIKDEFYRPSLEGKIILCNGAVQHAVQQSLDGEADSSVMTTAGTLTQQARHLLDDLQIVHDQRLTHHWKEELARLARDFKLKWKHESE